MYLNSHVKRIHPHTRRPHLLFLDYISRIKLTAKAWRGLRDGEADIRNESDPAAFISQHTLTPPPLFPAASLSYNNRFPITTPSFAPSLNHALYNI